MKVLDKDLLGRLPRTFVPSLNEKLKKWHLLFPAEQRLFTAQMDWIANLPAKEFDSLFAPIKAIEVQMDLPRWSLDSSGLSIQDVAVLARSPHYPRWRAEVETAFAGIDSAIESCLPQAPRLVLCVLPSGLPLSAVELWAGLSRKGKWVRLEAALGEGLQEFVTAIAGRKLPPEMEPVEGSWALECDTRLGKIEQLDKIPVFSWAALEPVRRKFLSRLNVIGKNLRSADEAHAELQRMNIARMLGPRLAKPRMREFVRGLLLSGNGALILGNAFVQWGSSESLRRVQPQALVASFGIRNKPKPFSSIVMFEDQKRSNPVPDEADPFGSLVDSQILAEYVYLAAERLAPYRGRTLSLFAAVDLDRILVLGPSKLPPLPQPATEGLSFHKMTAYTLQWLGSQQ